MKLILSFILSLLFVSTLNANCEKCDMKTMKKKCDTPSCNMKENKKSVSCGAGKCGANMKNMDMQPNKKKSKMCGCGMTKESCEKMMPKCKFRDQKKAQKT